MPSFYVNLIWNKTICSLKVITENSTEKMNLFKLKSTTSTHEFVPDVTHILIKNWTSENFKHWLMSEKYDQKTVIDGMFDCCVIGCNGELGLNFFKLFLFQLI